MPYGSTREVDFIIIADRMVFVADEKGFRGRIHGNESYWVLDSRESLQSPLNKMEYVARRLATGSAPLNRGWSDLPAEQGCSGRPL
jgi:hypothetical protein